jgi:uracil-DNA glycosylase
VETGFANEPASISKNDGLTLTAAVRCAPPLNKPNRDEGYNCSRYLYTETRILENTTVVIVVLGKIAFDAYCNICSIKGLAFGHNKIYSLNGEKTLIVSYHPTHGKVDNRSKGKSLITLCLFRIVFSAKIATI